MVVMVFLLGNEFPSSLRRTRRGAQDNFLGRAPPTLLLLSALRHLALGFRRRVGNRLATKTRLHNANQLFFSGVGGRSVEHDFAGMQKVNAIAYFEHLVVVVDD